MERVPASLSRHSGKAVMEKDYEVEEEEGKEKL